MSSLYLHIPFCERKCAYCDFYSVESTGSLGAFLQALTTEIALAGGTAAAAEEMETVYFGGGTPSLLEPSQLESIVGALHRSFRIAPSAEITLEANPGTVSTAKLSAYRSLGVNRLSFGVQSFNDDDLRFLGRIHDSAQAMRGIDDARSAGFENMSIDLIYSLPGQSASRWMESLSRANALSPAHISAYSLIVEDSTPLARMVKSGIVTPNPPDVEAELFALTMSFLLEHGYEHYEVSNYARPGLRSRHNSAYWRHTNYLGLGPSAHSFRKNGRTGRRWANIANISTYVERLRLGEPPVAFEETVSPSGLLNERIFLGLRSDGLDLESVRTDFDADMMDLRAPVVRGILDEGLGLLDGWILRLTPRGFLLCDEIATRLMF